MTAVTYAVDERLLDWASVGEAHNWRTLLIGNGASLAVWHGFRYPSLYEKATSSDIAHPLTAKDRAIFTALNTTNFETVLTALWTSTTVSSALGLPLVDLQERYDHVRKALVEAVHDVHVPHASIPASTLRALQLALLPFTTVYSTNYDLLLYWAVMHEGKALLKDYFWSKEHPYFDVTDTKLFANVRTVVYLHGGLHLVRTPEGRTKKLVADAQTLLDQFDAGGDVGETPLFISEGTAEDKLAAIARSDYLSFAYGRFTRNYDPLVVFGHSFGESDRHLTDAIRSWDAEVPVAISMRRAQPEAIVARKARLHEQLPRRQLLFFDAATHPLGKEELEVAP